MTARDMEMLDLLKCQIKFTIASEGDYEGTVLAVCPVVKKLVISKILYLPKKIPMGTLSFKFHEILNYTILNRPLTSDPQKNESNNYCYVPPRATDTCLLDDCSEAGDVDQDDDVCIDDLYEEDKGYQLNIPPQLSRRIPNDNVVIDRIDDEFHQAIKHILQQDCVGVSLDGPKISRNGVLSWLCVATSSCTFLFDIHVLGKRAFTKGLKEVLEDRNVEKVLHDCRQASDCLFHMFNTRLVNVFDSQVADLLVTMQRSKDGKFSKHVSRLDSCLRTYLEVPEDYIHKEKEPSSYVDKVNLHTRRPLQSGRRDVLLKNVVYLRTLKRELNFALLTPFHRGVEVYLQVLQTATDQELLLDSSVPEEIPLALLLEGIQVVRFKEFVEVPPVVASGPPYRKLVNPIKDYSNYCSKTKDVSSSTFNENDLFTSFERDVEQLNLKNNASSCVEPGDNFGLTLKSRVALGGIVNGTMHDMIQISQENSDISSNFDAGKVSLVRGTMNDMVQKSQAVKCQNPDSAKVRSPSSDSDSDLARPRDRYHDVLIRIRQRKNMCTNKSEPTTQRCDSRTNENADLVASNPVSIIGVSNTSTDSESDAAQQSSSYEDALEQVTERRKAWIVGGDSSCTSDGTNSDEEDPWAVLRAEFASNDDSAETVKRKIRYVPE